MGDNVMILNAERTVRRKEIEIRIEMHRDAAAGSLLEVGRQLCAAKDEGVVPHGEWTAWVQEHAAMSERVAQKWMQAARELPPGSPLERLGIAKIQSLMMIESGEREEFAERIGADRLSSREVDAAVKSARAERDEALRVVGEQKRAFSAKATECKDQARLLREADRKIVAIESELREKTNKVNSLNLVLAQRNSETNYLREQLEQAKQHEAVPDPETERKIALLESQIKSRDAAIAQRELEIDQLSDELDRAQLRIARGGMSPAEHSPVKAIIDAVGALMANAGQAPAQLRYLQGLDEETAMLLDSQVQSVARWAQAIHAAIYERGKSR